MACVTAAGACRVCSSAWGCHARRRDLGIPRAARPSGPRSKNGLGSKLAAVAQAHPGTRLQLWCEDEARVGQKGRTCHRWYGRGMRPPGLTDKRFESLSLFAACRPGTDQAFALALPEATTTTLNLAPSIHAVLILDRAGRHISRQLVVPENITLVPLPPYSPALNPVERVWLYLRERFLSHRVLDSYTAVLDAACAAWSALAAETGRGSPASPPTLICSNQNCREQVSLPRGAEGS